MKYYQEGGVEVQKRHQETNEEGLGPCVAHTALSLLLLPIIIIILLIYQ